MLLSWEGLYQASSLSSGVLEIEGKELLIPTVIVGPKERERADQWGSETMSVPPPQQCPVSNQANSSWYQISDTMIFLHFEIFFFFFYYKTVGQTSTIGLTHSL